MYPTLYADVGYISGGMAEMLYGSPEPVQTGGYRRDWVWNATDVWPVDTDTMIFDLAKTTALALFLIGIGLIWTSKTEACRYIPTVRPFDARKPRIELDESMEDQTIVQYMVEGDHGASNFVLRLQQQMPGEFVQTMLDLDDMNIRGIQISVGFRYIACLDIRRFVWMVQTRSEELVNRLNQEVWPNKAKNPLFDICPHKAVTHGASGGNRPFEEVKLESLADKFKREGDYGADQRHRKSTR